MLHKFYIFKYNKFIETIQIQGCQRWGKGRVGEMGDFFLVEINLKKIQILKKLPRESWFVTFLYP